MEVFTFGNGDFLLQIFLAVKGIMGDGSFSTLIRITVLLGFLLLLYQLFFSLNITTVSLGFIRHYIFIILIYYALFVPKTDIVIRDEIKDTQTSVTQVSYGVGLFAHMFTTAEKGITKLMETFFSTPNDMRFSESGYAYSVLVLDNLKAATAKDPYFKRTVDDFIVNCFFYDVLWGSKDLNQVIFSNDIFAEMAPANSGSAPTKHYTSTTPQGYGVTCTDAYGLINGELGPITTNALTQLNKIMQIDISSSLPVVMQRLTNATMSTTDILQQAIGINSVKSGFASASMYAGVSGDAVMYANALAEQQQRSSWIVAGELAKKYIPIVRQVLEAFVYGMFPILFIMMLTPFGMKALRTYFVMLFWLLLWSPLFAILNLIVNVRAENLLSATEGSFSLGTVPFVYQSTNDLCAMAGYIAFLVPTIAFAIAKGSEYALTNIASSIAGSTHGAATTPAAHISSPEGGKAIGANAAHMKFMESHGSESFANAMVASTYFQNAQGLAYAGIGYSGMDRLANSSVRGNQYKSEKFAGAADAYNGDMNLIRSVGAISGGREKGDHETFSKVARDYNFKSPEAAQAAISEVVHGQSISHSQSVKDFAQRHDLGTQDALGFMANTNMAKYDQVRSSFGGDIAAYRDFLSKNMELDVGKQLGVIKAAQAAGIDTLKEYGKMSSFMDTLQKSGAIEAYNQGSISDQDLKNIGSVGMQLQKGRTDAAKEMASLTGKSVSEMEQYLSTWKGINEYGKFKQIEGVAEKAGIKDKLHQALAHQGSGITMTLSNQEAKSAFGPSARGGNYNISMTADGEIQHTRSIRGVNDQSENIRKHTDDKRDVFASGSQHTSGDTYTGAPGFAQYKEGSAIRNFVMGDQKSSEKLFEGTPAQQQLQRYYEGKGFADDMTSIGARTGLKVDKIQASFGASTPPAFIVHGSASAQFEAIDQKQHNLYYSAYIQTVENAERTAASRGLTPAQAVAADRKALAEAVLKEANSAEKFFNINKASDAAKTGGGGGKDYSDITDGH